MRTFDPAKEKDIFVGQFDGTIFHKKVARTKHYMRREEGYGIQEEVVLRLKEASCRYIRISDEDTGKVYLFPFETIWNIKPREYSRHGLQRFLKISKTEKIESNQNPLF